MFVFTKIQTPSLPSNTMTLLHFPLTSLVSLLRDDLSYTSNKTTHFTAAAKALILPDISLPQYSA